MKTLTITSAKDLKKIDRKNIVNINGVEFGELYPLLEVTNKHVSFYDAESQGYKFISSPFNVISR